MNTLGIQWTGEMKFKFMVRRRMLILRAGIRLLQHLKEVFVRDPSNSALLHMHYLLLATHFNYKMLGFRADRGWLVSTHPYKPTPCTVPLLPSKQFLMSALEFKAAAILKTILKTRAIVPLSNADFIITVYMERRSLNIQIIKPRTSFHSTVQIARQSDVI